MKCEFKTSLSAKDIFVYDSMKTIKSGMDNRGENNWSYLYFYALKCGDNGPAID